MQKEIIKKGKTAVFTEDHETLKSIYNTNQYQDYAVNFSNIFLKLFFYACNHNRKSTIIFLLRVYFDIFTLPEQIGIRQSFYYGKYKIKDKNLAKWYSQSILPIIKVCWE